jgi:hypothetical protein
MRAPASLRAEPAAQGGIILFILSTPFFTRTLHAYCPRALPQNVNFTAS